ncbi:RidA family protein [Peribacillus frigoritolerans]|uniref:RidA family protein n=1 Tax=Peribacillus frigoritolerans TaxID=450367 RepID=UPI0021633DB6|nr:RidA family protein [Peribacillus frigoritolerans]
MEKQIKAPEQVLEELGIMLEPPREAVGNYVSHVRTGNLIFTSGQGVDDFHGKVGKELTEEEGYQAARQSMINLLRVLKDDLGELSRVKKVIKILGMVNSAENFTGQPKVLNGASDLLVAVFGERGRHARSAVGMAQLPNNTAIEIEMIVEIQD